MEFLPKTSVCEDINWVGSWLLHVREPNAVPDIERKFLKSVTTFLGKRYGFDGGRTSTEITLHMHTKSLQSFDEKENNVILVKDMFNHRI